MKPPHFRRPAKAVIGILGVAGLLLPSLGRANPIGDREVGLAGAVIATGWEPGSAHYNPAGLAWLKSSSLSLAANAYQLEMRQLDGLVQSIQSDNSVVDSTDRAEGFLSFPASLIYTYPIALSGWKAGLALGLLVPEADKRHQTASIDEGYWATHLERTTRSYVSVPTAAIGLRRGAWAFGMSVNFRLKETEEQLYHSDGSIESPDSLAGQEFQEMGLRNLDMMSLSMRAALGMQVELAKGWRGGLAFRSPSLHLWSRGTVNAVAFEGMPDWWCEPGPSQVPGCWYYYDVKGSAEAREASQSSLHLGIGRRQNGAADAFELSASYWFPTRQDQALTSLVGDDQDSDLVDFGDTSIYRPAAWKIALGWERRNGVKSSWRFGLAHRQDATQLEARPEQVFDEAWQTSSFTIGYALHRAAKLRQSASTTDLAFRFDRLTGEAVGLQWRQGAENEAATESFRLVSGSGFRVLCVFGGSFDLAPN